MSKTTDNILWAPQPRQAKALASKADELFYGGARGGGKSDFLLMHFFLYALYFGQGARGVLFRRNYPELEELLRRSRELYPPYATYSETKREWRFKNGASLKMRFLERDSDVHNYQGHQYSWIGFDELTNWPTDYCYTYMFSCLRSPEGLPCFVRSAGNPGSIGHQWVKERFIDGREPEREYYDEETGMTRVFIPARLDDNPALLEKDPGYEARLKMLPDYLYRAYRYGDWDVIAGAAFSDLRRDIHMIDVNDPPERLLNIFDFERMTPRQTDTQRIKIFRSIDWGYTAPFSVNWYFTDLDGRVYMYREMYGCKGANQGIQMPARDVAIRIRDIEEEHGERIALAVADASIWDKPSNQNERAEKLPSIAETMASEGVYFDRDMSVQVKKSRIQGKHQFHERLRVQEDGLPSFFVFSNCVHWWRTVPVLPIDDLNPEDVDTDAEDHAYDSTRYMLSARPMRSVKRERPHPMSLVEIYKRQDRRRVYV